MKTLRVLHVIPSVSTKHGGPSYAVESIASALQRAGIEVVIATTDDDGDHARLDVPLGRPFQRHGVTHLFFPRDFSPYKISFGLWRWLDQNVEDFDVIHIHALFSFSSTIAARAARRHGVPYVIRPLGVLNRWGMQHRRRILKSISFRMIEAPILHGASAIQFTTESERQEAALSIAFLGSLRSVVVPLPIPLRPHEQDTALRSERFFGRFPHARNKQIILYLSRIHPKKGIELLLEAFANLSPKHQSAILVIAGEGSPDYVSKLRTNVSDLEIGDRVVWTGFLTGGDKWAAFDAATIFVLPSFSENFGIALAEALACGVPSVITEGVGLSEEVQRANAGVVPKPTSQAIALALDDLLKDADKRRHLAENGRRFAISRFSPESVGSGLGDLYRELVQRYADAK